MPLPAKLETLKSLREETTPNSWLTALAPQLLDEVIRLHDAFNSLETNLANYVNHYNATDRNYTGDMTPAKWRETGSVELAEIIANRLHQITEDPQP